jgi:hypothetical protein
MTPTTEELVALLEGTTPGPWTQGSGWIGRLEPEFECLISYGHCADDVGTDADAELMALAPTLAREVLRLRAEQARLRRILAVGRGDANAAPEGWSSLRQDHLLVWYRTAGGERLRVEDCLSAWRWEHKYSLKWGTAPTALEAMEAADAALAGVTP